MWRGWSKTPTSKPLVWFYSVNVIAMAWYCLLRDLEMRPGLAGVLTMVGGIVTGGYLLKSGAEHFIDRKREGDGWRETGRPYDRDEQVEGDSLDSTYSGRRDRGVDLPQERDEQGSQHSDPGTGRVRTTSKRYTRRVAERESGVQKAGETD